MRREHLRQQRHVPLRCLLQLLHLAHVEPELRLDTRQHLLRLEGLCDVVAASCLETLNDVLGRGLAADHDDRRGDAGDERPHLEADLERGERRVLGTNPDLGQYRPTDGDASCPVDPIYSPPTRTDLVSTEVRQRDVEEDELDGRIGHDENLQSLCPRGRCDDLVSGRTQQVLEDVQVDWVVVNNQDLGTHLRPNTRQGLMRHSYVTHIHTSLVGSILGCF